MPYTNQNKSSSRFVNYIKHARIILRDILSTTPDDVVMQDGKTLKSLTPDELDDPTYTNQTKN